jgi:hypothetical protein
LLRADFKKLASLRYPAEHQATLPRYHRDLAGEFAGTMCRYRALARKIRLHDFHPARKHNEKWNLHVIRTKEDFARLNFAHFAEGAKPINLRWS